MSAPPKALVCASVLVLALHGALLSYFSRWGLGGNSVLTQTAPTAVQAFLVTTALSTIQSTDQSTEGSPQVSHAAAPVAQAQATTERSETKPADEISAGYLREAQVEKSAELLGEWVINTAPWNDGQVVKIAIRILISAQGRVDRWYMSDGSAPEPPILESLANIDRTIFRPAMRAGKPVASQRDVELIIYKD